MMIASSATAQVLVGDIGSNGRFRIEGYNAQPQRLAPWPTASPKREFFVDSVHGDDSFDGRASRPSRGRGPWRSLAMLGRQGLGAGDVVTLACGSTWVETLRIRSDASADIPVVIRAAPNCVEPPTIDGSTELATKDWVRVQGPLFATRLQQAPLDVQSSDHGWAPAHHPNARPEGIGGIYAPLPSDGNVVRVDRRVGSTEIELGDAHIAGRNPQDIEGARLVLRINAWLMDEGRIASLTGRLARLDTLTGYPAQAGWGAFLVGKPWMVDSPGEWHFDTTTGRLLAWLPNATDGAAPVRVTVLPVGLDLANSANVVIDGIRVRRVGTGAVLRGSTNIRIRRATFEDVVDRGIDASASKGATVEGSLFERTGLDAIAGHVPGRPEGARMTILGNVVRFSGVLLKEGKPLGLPRRSLAAIYTGPDSIVRGNVIQHAGYIGIRGMESGLIDGNLVSGACAVLDDCAGIYVWKQRNASISRNVVIDSIGNDDGKPASEPRSAAQGIYLDESTVDSSVVDNVVLGNDNGIFIHVSSRNRIAGNIVVGNRRSQIWMQADRNREFSLGDVNANTVERNVIAPIGPSQHGILLESAYLDLSQAASFLGNLHLEHGTGASLRAKRAGKTLDYAMSQWFDSKDRTLAAVDRATVVRPKDIPTIGENLLSNGMLETGLAGWNSASEKKPDPRLLWGRCEVGPCMTLTDAGSDSRVTSPNFSIVAGRWYRLSFFARATNDDDVRIIIRRGGGRRNGFERLADRVIPFEAGAGWRETAVLFRAEKGVRANDPDTGDLGARVDFEDIAPQTQLQLARLRLQEVAPAYSTHSVWVLGNLGKQARELTCADVSAEKACQGIRTLDPAVDVKWPLLVGPGGFVVLYRSPLEAETSRYRREASPLRLR